MRGYSYQELVAIELPKLKSKYKNLLRRKGEDAVYAELKSRYKYKTIFGIQIKDFIEDLKAEIEQKK